MYSTVPDDGKEDVMVHLEENKLTKYGFWCLILLESKRKMKIYTT